MISNIRNLAIQRGFFFVLGGCHGHNVLLYSPSLKRARVAQLVEQRIENPRVTGSIPVSGTILLAINLKL
jgi:hypothetical protein